MMQVSVELVGPSNKDRSPRISNQTTMNMYLAPGMPSKWACYDFWGCKPFISASGTDRGFYVFNEVLYRVLSGSLLRVAEDGSAATLGAIGGTGRCIFADDGIKLVITTSGFAYVYDGATVTPITDPNLETPISVSYLNGFFLYDGEASRFQSSDAGDPATINALSVGIANSDGDLIIRGFTHNQLVYWFGPRAIEPWYFSGSGDLPFERLEQGIVKRGLGAAYSLASTNDAMFFLGADRQVYRMAQSLSQSITKPAIKAIESFAVIDDAIGWTFTMDNQEFYFLTFPTESKTYLYSITMNEWVYLSQGMHGARHIANSYAYCYGKHFVADYRNGNVYTLDKDTYTDNGETRLRWRDTAPITGDQVGLPGRRLICGKIGINMEIGVGLAYGQGVNPQIMCRLSGDGGKTYTPETFVDVGVMGEYDKRVDYDQFIDGYSITMRILCADPVYLSIFGGLADIDDGGY